MVKGLDEIVGQEPALTILRQALFTKRLHHAYLFEGIEGIGKATCAKALFATLNCEHPPALATICKTCSSCQKISSGSHPDLLFFDMTPNGLAEQVEKLLNRVSYPPHEGRVQMVLFDPADTFSLPTASVAANRLLKMLEEPIANTHFVFICTNATNLLPTLRSRMQRIRFQPLSSAVINQLLTEQENQNRKSSESLMASQNEQNPESHSYSKTSDSTEKKSSARKKTELAKSNPSSEKEKIFIKLSPEEKQMMIDLAQGSIGKALAYQQEQELWKKRQELAQSLQQAVLSGNTLDMMKAAAQEELSNRDESQIVLQLLWMQYYQQLSAKLQTSSQETTSFSPLAQRKIIQQLKLIQEASEAIKRYVSPTLTLERLLSKLG